MRSVFISTISVMLLAASAAFGQDEQAFNLRPGWNLISLNVVPDEEFCENDVPQIELILEPVWERVRIIKDERGKIIIPSMNHFGFQEWRQGKAYWIYFTERVNFSVTGEQIEVTTPIELPAGWSFFAYYPTNERFASSCFRSLHDDEARNIVKSGRGNFIAVDGYGFEWMTRPGEGYMAWLHRPRTMRYRD